MSRPRNLPFFAALAAFAISANAVPPLMSSLSVGLALPAWAFGVGITLQYTSFAALSWLGGLAVEHRGVSPHSLVLAGLVAISAALAVAPLTLASIWTLLPWMCVLGLAGGAVETFASMGLAEGSPAGSNRTLCLSQAFYSLGAFIAPLAAAAALGSRIGWRWAFALFATLAAATALGFALSRRGRKAADSRISNSAEGGIGVGVGVGDEAPCRIASEADQQGRGVGYFRAFLFVYVLAETFCASFMPYMLETQRGLEPRSAALATAIFWLAMVAGRIIFAFLPGRLRPAPSLTVAAAMATAGAILLLTLPAAYAVALSILGAAMGPIWPVAVQSAADRLRSPAATASVIAAGGLGAAAGPLLGSLLLAGGLAPAYFAVLTSLFMATTAITAAGLARARRTAG